MNKVLIVLGSKSDEDIARKATGVLDHFEVPYDVELASADRTPEKVTELSRKLELDLYDVCIAIAGMSAVLPAAIKSRTTKLSLEFLLQRKVRPFQEWTLCILSSKDLQAHQFRALQLMVGKMQPYFCRNVRIK